MGMHLERRHESSVETLEEEDCRCCCEIFRIAAELKCWHLVIQFEKREPIDVFVNASRAHSMRAVQLKVTVGRKKRSNLL